jgi:hypothetical protein
MVRHTGGIASGGGRVNVEGSVNDNQWRAGALAIQEQR